MGIIRRQSVKQGVVSYLAVLVGAFSTIAIYPLALETYGTIGFIVDSGLLLAPLLLLGLNHLPVMFRQKVMSKDPSGGGFMGLILILLFASYAAFTLLYILFRGQISSIVLQHDKLVKIHPYLDTIFIIALLIGLTLVLTKYIISFQRIVVPSLLNNLIMKLSLALLVYSVHKGYMSSEELGLGLIIMYVITCLGLTLYLVYMGKVKISMPSAELLSVFKKEMIPYSLVTMLGGIGIMVAFRIDSIMVSTLVGYDQNGIYRIALFISAVISIPTIAVTSIAAPVISDALARNRMDEIEVLYESASRNLLIIGCSFFVVILGSIADLKTLIPNGDKLDHLLILVAILGLAKIADMMTSVNNEIIQYSEYFRFNLIMVLILAVTNIVANYLLIVVYSLGMIGAAVSTFMSLLLYNLAKLFYIYMKFKLHPFSKRSILVFLIAAILLFVSFNLNFGSNPIVKIALRSFVIIMIYGVLIYKLKLSEEFNKYIRELRQMIGIKHKY